MSRFLRQLQEKPAHVRRTIALTTATGIFLVIVAIWTSSSMVSPQQTNGTQGASAWSSFVGIFSGLFDQIKGGLPQRTAPSPPPSHATTTTIQDPGENMVLSDLPGSSSSSSPGVDTKNTSTEPSSSTTITITSLGEPSKN